MQKRSKSRSAREAVQQRNVVEFPGSIDPTVRQPVLQPGNVVEGPAETAPGDSAFNFPGNFWEPDAKIAGRCGCCEIERSGDMIVSVTVMNGKPLVGIGVHTGDPADPEFHPFFVQRLSQLSEVALKMLLATNVAATPDAGGEPKN